MEWVFWVGVAGLLYAYAGYPLLLSLLPRRGIDRATGDAPTPRVSVILPAYNEAGVIGEKLANTLELDYPADRREVIVVSDGSSDETEAIVRGIANTAPVRLLVQPERLGKAAALNRAMEAATGDIVVFTDASILLERDALKAIVAPFADEAVGIVSGEDVIEGTGGEALYGRYELFLRRRESAIHSIVGASGCFYAQRRGLCTPFPPGEAPDFVSVLRTVRAGYRAVSEPAARGHMRSVAGARREFERKVRTLIRGMAALWSHRDLLSVRRYGLFALLVFSHKVVRWLVPVFLAAMFVASTVLAPDSAFQAAALLAQLVAYAAAGIGLAGRLGGFLPIRAAAFFVSVNAAIAVAWFRFLSGGRQELWEPSKRTP